MANKFVASQTIYYLCKQNAEFYTNQLGAMDDLHYNCIKPVLEEKNKTGTWLSESHDEETKAKEEHVNINIFRFFFSSQRT